MPGKEPAMENLQKIMKNLAEAKRDFDNETLNPVQYSRAREKLLLEALMAMGAELGVRLEKPTCIDANGEIRIVAIAENGQSPNLGCGQFGEEFSKLLNEHNPRTGTRLGTVLDVNGWCYMNHFEVEKMAQSYAAGAPVS